MRRFSSCGPDDPTENLCVERREFVERCVDQLVGNPDTKVRVSRPLWR